MVELTKVESWDDALRKPASGLIICLARRTIECHEWRWSGSVQPQILSFSAQLVLLHGGFAESCRSHGLTASLGVISLGSSCMFRSYEVAGQSIFLHIQASRGSSAQWKQSLREKWPIRYSTMSQGGVDILQKSICAYDNYQHLICIFWELQRSIVIILIEGVPPLKRTFRSHEKEKTLGSNPALNMMKLQHSERNIMLPNQVSNLAVDVCDPHRDKHMT